MGHFHAFHGCYHGRCTTLQYHRLYTNALSRTLNPPHIYWVADHAYHRMCSSNADQVLLISGESGAGKTETTKFIVEHLAHVCGKRVDNLHEKIVQVSPCILPNKDELAHV